jgi:hypothetical protein
MEPSLEALSFATRIDLGAVRVVRVVKRVKSYCRFFCVRFTDLSKPGSGRRGTDLLPFIPKE